MLSIRAAVAEELERLWQIDQESFPPGIAYSRRELRAYMSMKGSFTLVAEQGGQQSPELAGFLVARVPRASEGQIITIDVLPHARRHRIGWRLIQAAEERLRRAGCGSARLEVAVNNFPALHFYKRMGYSIAGTIPRYYLNSVDALVLSKNLAEGGP